MLKTNQKTTRKIKSGCECMYCACIVHVRVLSVSVYCQFLCAVRVRLLSVSVYWPCTVCVLSMYVYRKCTIRILSAYCSCIVHVYVMSTVSVLSVSVYPICTCDRLLSVYCTCIVFLYFIVYFSDQSIHTIKHIYIFQCICSQPHRAYQSLQIRLLQAS